MAAPPYMKLYIADYLADTTHLAASEHGAYLLLLMAMWRAGGRLPRDDGRLAKIAKMAPEEWADAKPILLEFFCVAGGHLKHRRLSKEITQYERVVNGAKRAGIASASKKSRKNNEQASTNVGQTLNERSVNVQRKTNQLEPELKEPPLPPSGDKNQEIITVSKTDVEAIWKATPPESKQRSGKADLKRALEAAARRGHAIENIRDGLVIYFQSETATKNGREYVRGVHRMVEQDRWEAFNVSFEDALGSPDVETIWRGRVHAFASNEFWNRLEWGPSPGKPGCKASPAIQRELGFKPAGPVVVEGST